ncbi:type 1 glutamine amidotransferase domain-containing protein [Nocardia iowensis]|uniref:Type 1 glutamine amidotransferase domain-containing protein n=1 Tax=Nocardia iowensis TaxID=204891 RepID=A0ABX8RX80_NOCIO|nr:type 1 glutamine amidotransferase domain-containing protein [Nocardia iowensis]QXN94252.1 type 1 glutamine amidotransferase domain-containing protein [Nocardia iowensis]
MRSALFVVTNVERVPGFPKPTGFDIREAAAVWSVLQDFDYQVSFASLLGGTANGVLKGEITDPINSFIHSFSENLAVPTSTVRSHFEHYYDLVYFVGGLGCMWDFPYKTDLHTLIHYSLVRGARIASICHGPAAFLGLTDTLGTAFTARRHLTAFSDAEEISRGVLDLLPFSLQQALIATGAYYSRAGDGESHVVVDGPLISAQNPASLPEFSAILATHAALERTMQ